MSTPELSERLQSIRKRRGLTQRELADLSGVSLSLLRKLEQGEREDTRVETLRKLAVALKVSTSELIVRPKSDPAPASDDTQWDAVKRALVGRPFGESPAEEPTSEGVRSAVQALEPLFYNNRYSELGVLLPPLLRDADALGDEGRAERARVLHLTGLLMTSTRQFDMAEMALSRAVDDAPDRLDAAAAIKTKCWLLIRQGDLQGTFDLATRWADEVEPRMSRATMSELATWGGLMLKASSAAVRNNQPGTAEDALKLAHAAAVVMRREYASSADPVRAFGSAVVAMKRAENAVIEGRPDRVLAISATIPRGGLRPNSANRHRHRLDVANANLQLKRYGDAFEILREVRTAAPEWIVHQAQARNILHKINKRRRTLTPDMRELADFIRLDY
ncbi:helix-turn-helix transcriptional regulator [Sphaerisporangium sp. NPDC051011]|uniref:helix-turn-helix domain-containing protein n=1 Tax=Sphaerisporangium sp. NPDC051011 TaxID=3155792 RepID=UPI0033D51ACE